MDGSELRGETLDEAAVRDDDRDSGIDIVSADSDCASEAARPSGPDAVRLQQLLELGRSTEIVVADESSETDELLTCQARCADGRVGEPRGLCDQGLRLLRVTQLPHAPRNGHKEHRNDDRGDRVRSTGGTADPGHLEHPLECDRSASYASARSMLGPCRPERCRAPSRSSATRGRADDPSRCARAVTADRRPAARDRKACTGLRGVLPHGGEADVDDSSRRRWVWGSRGSSFSLPR